MQEVSKVHSTKRRPYQRNPLLKEPFGKERIRRKPLNPYYIAGFIDGEGSFSISINKHKTLRSGIEIKPEFEIELRADDKEILKRIVATVGCGRIYDCSYERYGWYPHVKLKITSACELEEKFFPFINRYPLQAKKKRTYELFKKIVLLVRRKKHLTEKGIYRIIEMRNKMRKYGKKHNFVKQINLSLETARIRENRSSGGVGRLNSTDPDTARQVKGAGNTQNSALWT